MKKNSTANIINFLDKSKLEIIVFICGALIMVYELAGSRVMAPYLGTSIIVWTGLIGVVMACLSLGYYLGGIIADKGADYKFLSMVIFLSGLFVLSTTLFGDLLLSNRMGGNADIRMATFQYSLILFGPASFFLGIISPYAVKLRMDSLKNSGETVGTLSAISTMGGIVGTFLAGFYLVAYLGTINIMLLTAATLIMLSLFCNTEKYFVGRLFALLVTFALVFFYKQNKILKEERGFIDIDTRYNRVIIFDGIDPRTKQKIRYMKLGTQNASAMFLENDDLAYEYSKKFNYYKDFKPETTRTLVIGGAAYSYPMELIKNLPNGTVDVVEIDEQLPEIAKKYFSLKDLPNLENIAEDARTFLNRNSKTYDVIFMDAFGSGHSVPHHLTTLEFAQHIYDSLSENGILFANLITSVDGKNSLFLQSEYLTYKELFPKIYVIPVYPSVPREQFQNVVLIAFKDENFEHEILNEYAVDFSTEEGIVLTDDFAPVESYFFNF